jgi:hypothetical protein
MMCRDAGIRTQKKGFGDLYDTISSHPFEALPLRASPSISYSSGLALFKEILSKLHYIRIGGEFQTRL